MPDDGRGSGPRRLLATAAVGLVLLAAATQLAAPAASPRETRWTDLALLALGQHEPAVSAAAAAGVALPLSGGNGGRSAALQVTQAPTAPPAITPTDPIFPIHPPTVIATVTTRTPTVTVSPTATWTVRPTVTATATPTVTPVPDLEPPVISAVKPVGPKRVERRRRVVVRVEAADDRSGVAEVAVRVCRGGGCVWDQAKPVGEPDRAAPWQATFRAKRTGRYVFLVQATDGSGNPSTVYPTPWSGSVRAGAAADRNGSARGSGTAADSAKPRARAADESNARERESDGLDRDRDRDRDRGPDGRRVRAMVPPSAPRIHRRRNPAGPSAGGTHGRRGKVRATARSRRC